MKKNHFIARKGLFSLALAAVGAMFLGSCAEGFDSKETFDSGVYNTVLSSPESSSLSFSKKSNTDGSESIQVTWKVVMGAGGYECKAYNVDDPEKPVEVATSTVDSPVFTFKCADDTKYKVEIRTLGNEKKNNTAAEQPSSAEYNTLVPAQVIPADVKDVAEYINTHLLDTQDEQAFELVANGEYTMESSIDFKDKKVTLRGDKVHHPILKLGANAVVYTSAQLKVKFINFDCTENTHKGGIIEMSPEPPASCSAEAQGINAQKNKDKPADVYILQDPIIIQECAFKNVIDGLFSVGQCSWGISDVRVLNSVVQLRNNGSKNSNGAVICGVSTGKAPSGGSFWYGGIKNIMIKNSTIYNIESNGKNRMFRFNNKDLDRVFPTPDGSCTMTDNTFIRVYDKKEFGNNTPNRKEYVITYDNNIFYDCFRLQKFMQGNCTLEYHQDKNTVWGDASTVDGTDKGKLATEENPGFVNIDDTKKELDFTLSNYGINFAASGSISSTIGDPRWKASAE